MSKVFLFTFLIIFIIPSIGFSFDKQKVLIINSYSTNDPTGKYEQRVLIQKLGFAKYRYRIVYLMSVKHPPGSVDFDNAIYHTINVIADYKPNILVTIDDIAFKYIGRKYIGTCELKVYFIGVSQSLQYYGLSDDFIYSSPKLTGGIFKWFNILDIYDYIKESTILPKTIYIIHDQSIIADALVSQLKNNYSLKITKVLVCDFDSLVKFMLEHKYENVVIIPILKRLKYNNHYISSYKIYDYIRKYNRNLILVSYNKELICKYACLGISYNIEKSSEILAMMINNNNYSIEVLDDIIDVYYNPSKCSQDMILPNNILKKLRGCID